MKKCILMHEVFEKYPIRFYERHLDQTGQIIFVVISLLVGFFFKWWLDWTFPYTNEVYLTVYLLLRVTDGITTNRVSKLLPIAALAGIETDIEEQNPLLNRAPTWRDLVKPLHLLAQMAGLVLVILHPGLGLYLILASMKVVLTNWRIGNRLRFAISKTGYDVNT